VLQVAKQKRKVSFKLIHHSSYMHHNRQEMPHKHGRLHHLNFRVYFEVYIIMEGCVQYKKGSRSDSAQNLNFTKSETQVEACYLLCSTTQFISNSISCASSVSFNSNGFCSCLLWNIMLGSHTIGYRNYWSLIFLWAHTLKRQNTYKTATL